MKKARKISNFITYTDMARCIVGIINTDVKQANIAHSPVMKGTGAFISPDGLILTCAHVLKDKFDDWKSNPVYQFEDNKKPINVDIFWNAEKITLTAKILFWSLQDIDLAILETNPQKNLNIPVIYAPLGIEPSYTSGRTVIIRGYGTSSGKEILEVRCALGAIDIKEIGLFKRRVDCSLLKATDNAELLLIELHKRFNEISSGHSGAPVWLENVEKKSIGQIAGVCFASRKQIISGVIRQPRASKPIYELKISDNIGGWAIPTSTILQYLKTYHQNKILQKIPNATLLIHPFIMAHTYCKALQTEIEQEFEDAGITGTLIHERKFEKLMKVNQEDKLQLEYTSVSEQEIYELLDAPHVRVLLGSEMGLGKTIFMKQLVLAQIQNVLNEHSNRIPILLYLRNHFKGTMSLHDLLAKEITRLLKNRLIHQEQIDQWKEILLTDQKFILFCDGWDEYPGKRKISLNPIETEETHPSYLFFKSAKTIPVLFITSRLWLIEQNLLHKQPFRNYEITNESVYRNYILKLFSEDQARKYIGILTKKFSLKSELNIENDINVKYKHMKEYFHQNDEHLNPLFIWAALLGSELPTTRNQLYDQLFTFQINWFLDKQQLKEISEEVTIRWKEKDSLVEVTVNRKGFQSYLKQICTKLGAERIRFNNILPAEIVEPLIDEVFLSKNVSDEYGDLLNFMLRSPTFLLQFNEEDQIYQFIPDRWGDYFATFYYHKKNQNAIVCDIFYNLEDYRNFYDFWLLFFIEQNPDTYNNNLKDYIQQSLSNEYHPEDLIQFLGDLYSNNWTFCLAGIKIHNGTITAIDSLQRRMKEVPEVIGKLTKLKSLNFTASGIETLPESIGLLSDLEILILFKNKLNTLPKTFSQLSSLKELNIGGSGGFKTIPEEIFKLSSLKFLSLRYIKADTIPKEICQLSKLERLDLYSMNLLALPESIGELTNLKYLDLMHNLLPNLPATIGKLSNLNYLRLEENFLSKLPESIGQLSNLETLLLKHNSLKVLPESIGQLSNLKVLDLRHNLLIKLPITINKLIDLKIQRGGVFILESRKLRYYYGSITHQQSDYIRTVKQQHYKEVLAQLHSEMKRDEEILPLIQDKLESQKENLDPNHPDVLSIINHLISLLDNLASIYEELGHNEKALHLFYERFELQKEVLGSTNSETILSLENLADLCHKMGRQKTALCLLHGTLYLVRKEIGYFDVDHTEIYSFDDHPLVKKIRMKIKEVLS